MCPFLHAPVFNWCCQQGHQANVFSVFGKRSYGLSLLPDSIFVLAWFENVCCGHLSGADRVAQTKAPCFWDRSGHHFSREKNDGESDMVADIHKLKRSEPSLLHWPSNRFSARMSRNALLLLPEDVCVCVYKCMHLLSLYPSSPKLGLIKMWKCGLFLYFHSPS